MDTKQLALFEVKEMTKGVRRTKERKKETYEEFLEKFQEKHTTDECYTPKAVYDVVCNFVRKLPGVGNRPFVRPFYPGGDYENYEYPEGCIVVDNPPFSIISKIIRFYEMNGIDFFLFSQHVTVIVRGVNATYVITDVTIKYENGAKINTSFITSLIPDVKIWMCGSLADEIRGCQGMQKDKLNKYRHNKNIITPALLGKYIRKDTDLKIPKKECIEISNSDFMRNIGKSLFGNGYIISDRIKNLIYEEKIRDNVIEIELSEREKKIVERLNKQSGEKR